MTARGDNGEADRVSTLLELLFDPCFIAAALLRWMPLFSRPDTDDAINVADPRCRPAPVSRPER
jgi:hypothetical protein